MKKKKSVFLIGNWLLGVSIQWLWLWHWPFTLCFHRKRDQGPADSLSSPTQVSSKLGGVGAVLSSSRENEEEEENPEEEEEEQERGPNSSAHY